MTTKPLWELSCEERESEYLLLEPTRTIFLAIAQIHGAALGGRGGDPLYALKYIEDVCVKTEKFLKKFDSV